MRILYYSDLYTWENMGTKRSIFEELQAQGHTVQRLHHAKIAECDTHVEQFEPDQIWLVHSGLRLPYKKKGKYEAKGIVVVGVGMSDPYLLRSRKGVYEDIRRFNPNHLRAYDVYVTNHFETYYAYRDTYPIVYNRTACDFRFHQDLGLKKILPLTLLGVAEHPRFIDPLLRPKYVDKLRKGYSVHTYGKSWLRRSHPHNHNPIEGETFLRVINRSHLGLDLQEYLSPLAHRMFEYAACGVPCITARRPEVLDCFEDNEEILTYTFEHEFFEKVHYYMKHLDELRQIGLNALERCRKEHDISHRVTALLQNISKVLNNE